MGERGTQLWEGIVGGYPGDHFSAGDLPLLENYVRCVLIIDECNRSIGSEGLTVETAGGPKTNPCVTIRDAQIRNLATLATKLRISVSARLRADSAKTRPGSSARPWEFGAEAGG